MASCGRCQVRSTPTKYRRTAILVACLRRLAKSTAIRCCQMDGTGQTPIQEFLQAEEDPEVEVVAETGADSPRQPTRLRDRRRPREEVTRRDRLVRSRYRIVPLLRRRLLCRLREVPRTHARMTRARW